jgi:hypothetical protein
VKYIPFFPEEDYLKHYKWIMFEESDAPCALVTFHTWDIVLYILDGIPTLACDDSSPVIPTWRFDFKIRNPPKRIQKYVLIWTSSGIYRAVHLKEFLDKTVPWSEIR